MTSYNIRILYSHRIEYNGSIIVDKDGSIYGKGTDNNYDEEAIFMGTLSKDKKTLIFNLISSTGNKTEVRVSQNECFRKTSIAPSIYFYGYTINNGDCIGWSVELTSFKDIEKTLIEEKARTLK